MHESLQRKAGLSLRLLTTPVNSLLSPRARGGRSAMRSQLWADCGATDFRDRIRSARAETSPPEPLDREMFPVLTAARIERIAPLGRERSFESGDVVFERGGTNRPLNRQRQARRRRRG